MSSTVAIVGAGVMGRLMALKLHAFGYRVSIFDEGDWLSDSSCSFAAAGMLAPYCELEDAEPIIAELGLVSLRLWPKILGSLDQPVFFRQLGSLVAARASEERQLDELKEKIARRATVKAVEIMRDIERSELDEFLPGLSESCTRGVLLPSEGQINNQQLLRALATAIGSQGIESCLNIKISALGPHEVSLHGTKRGFDQIVDCRGLGASDTIHDLRGVRGELILLEAPEVKLKLPLRIMHPRYPIYVVPRGGPIFAVGATSIESEDAGPMTLKSALDLLTPLYNLHAGFRQSRILQLVANCRPAFPDNLPQIRHKKGLMQINGLYRHGFLLAPALAEAAARFLAAGVVSPTRIFKDLDECT